MGKWEERGTETMEERVSMRNGDDEGRLIYVCTCGEEMVSAKKGHLLWMVVSG